MTRHISPADLRRELGWALRLLARRPGFAAVALATLALGIGAPTAIFSVVHAVLLRPLPYPDADRIVQFRIEGRSQGGPLAFDALPVSDALAWGATSTTLDALGFFNDRALTLTTAEGPFRLMGVAGTPNLFAILGVQPAIGRTYDDDLREIVLSDAIWRRHFSADRAAIGTTATFDGDAYRIVGVMPPDFGFPTPDAAFWVPMRLDVGGSRGMLLPAIARLTPGATLAGVIEEGRRLLDDLGMERGERTLLVRTMQEQMVGGVHRMLWVLMAAVSFVFVIATANIALLLLTRGAGREREFSIRLALGAGRARLVRQLFIEAVALAALGGALGVALAVLALHALLALAPQDMPRLQEASLEANVLAFAAALTVTASVVFGVLSAGRAIATDPVRALGRLGGDANAPIGRASRRRLNVLAGAELALTVVLLVGAGLLLRSFIRAVLIDQGFDHRSAVAMQINLPASRYPNPGARLAFHERLLEALRNVKGLESAGLTTAMPNRQPSARFDFNAVGIPLFRDPLSTPVAEVRTVSEGFLEAMVVPLRAGRFFRADDTPGSEPVMVISEMLAKQRFPGRSPIGQLLYSGTGTRRVIGVAGDVRPAAPGAVPSGAAYLTMRQDEDIFQWFGTATLVLRGRNLDSTAASIRALVLSLDPGMPPFNVRTLSREVSRLVATPRFAATLLAIFAAIALVLAAIGVYGVMAHAAGQRTREIGVRIALGATRGQVLRLMLRDGLATVAGGLGAGLLLAIWLARGLTGLLHEVTPADPIALTSVAAILASAGTLAVYLPARRATRVSALDALRDH